MSDYWTDAVSEALHEADISATDDEVDIIAICMESSLENYGMAHGHDAIPNPLIAEMDKKVAAVTKRAQESHIILLAEVALQKNYVEYWRAQYENCIEKNRR